MTDPSDSAPDGPSGPDDAAQRRDNTRGRLKSFTDSDVRPYHEMAVEHLGLEDSEMVAGLRDCMNRLYAEGFARGRADMLAEVIEQNPGSTINVESPPEDE